MDCQKFKKEYQSFRIIDDISQTIYFQAEILFFADPKVDIDDINCM